ncbi:MAG: hypothetical protein R3F60_13240 [bacterium]
MRREVEKAREASGLRSIDTGLQQLHDLGADFAAVRAAEHLVAEIRADQRLHPGSISAALADAADLEAMVEVLRDSLASGHPVDTRSLDGAGARSGSSCGRRNRGWPISTAGSRRTARPA